MATRQADIDADAETSGVVFSTTGTVTNTVRVTYDTTKNEGDIIAAFEKIWLALVKELPLTS